MADFIAYAIISAFIGLQSYANLPCVVNLALNVLHLKARTFLKNVFLFTSIERAPCYAQFKFECASWHFHPKMHIKIREWKHSFC